MNYTWGEIQIQSIQKMFLNNQTISVSDLTSMKTDRVYRTYLNAMPNVANEGIMLLMRRGEPLIKTYEFTQNIPDKILNNMNKETILISDADYTYEQTGSKAYYFEIDGSCTVKIQKLVNNVWTDIETLLCKTTGGKYKAFKGLISNTDNSEIRLLFIHEYIYNVRNIALYDVNFRNRNDIIDNTGKQRYDFNILIDDLFQISSVEIEPYDNNYGVYANSYTMNNDNIFILNSDIKGNIIVKYIAYPDKITSTTSDSYVFTLPHDMLMLLPLYIASELYKDDDLALSTMYRNEFEAGLNAIIKRPTGLEFTSVTGWI